MKEKHARRLDLARRIITAVLLILALAGILRSDYVKNWRDQKGYERLARQVKEETSEANETGEETDEESPYVSPIDFEKLAQVNPDVVGWIHIPGTRVDYPIVQSSDNDAYLYRNFEGKYSRGGSIFLDFESPEDMRGYNNLLYGHNMKNGGMFSDINSYKDEAYFKEHQYFEIYTPKECIHLKAVSCYYLGNDPEVRTTDFQDDQSFQDFVKAMVEPCPYGEMPEKPVKNLYALVTCSYETDDARTVLFAVETDRETLPEDELPKGAATQN